MNYIKKSTTPLFVFVSMMLFAVQAAQPTDGERIDKKEDMVMMQKEQVMVNNLDKLTKKTLQDLNLDKKYWSAGLGGIQPNLRHSYYSAINKWPITKDPELRPNFLQQWDAHYGHGMTEEQKRKELKYMGVCVAEAMVKAHGESVFYNYYQRKEKENQYRANIRSEERLINVQNKASLDYWQKFGRLLFGGLQKVFGANQEEVRVRLLYTASFISLLFFTYFLIKEGMPYVMKLIFGTNPQIIKEKRLSWRFWRSKKQPSRIKELHYHDNVTTWLQKSIDLDTKRVLHNQKTGRHGKKYHFHSVLLKGEPGTGKTALAREYANQTDMDFIKVGGSAWSKLSEAEALIHFSDTLTLARRNPRPVLFFIDEVDVVFPQRTKSQGVTRKITSSFLENIADSYHDHIKFMYASNLASEIDPAVISRVAEQVKVNKPNERICQKIYATYLAKFCRENSVKAPSIDEPLQGLTGRDIKEICNKVAEEASLNKQQSIKKQAIVNVIRFKKTEKTSLPNTSKKEVKPTSPPDRPATKAPQQAKPPTKHTPHTATKTPEIHSKTIKFTPTPLPDTTNWPILLAALAALLLLAILWLISKKRSPI